MINYGNLNSDNILLHFIDVREGDAILVQYKGENYLIVSGRNLSSDKLINYISGGVFCKDWEWGRCWSEKNGLATLKLQSTQATPRQENMEWREFEKDVKSLGH